MSAARRTAFRIAFALTALGAIASSSVTWLEPYPPLRAFAIARASGWLAALLLVLALCVSPLRWVRRALRFPESSWLSALRRSAGIAAACAAIAHVAIALGTVPALWESLLDFGWLRSGAAALLLLLALLITSFDAVVRRLRLQHWKLLHTLVYPAALLVAMHASLGPFGGPTLELALSAAIVTLLTVRVWHACTRNAASRSE